MGDIRIVKLEGVLPGLAGDVATYSYEVVSVRVSTQSYNV